MENEFFLNAGIPAPPALHFETSSLVEMSSWTSGMGIQAMELNCSVDQSVDCCFNPNWEKSTDYGVQFDSALSSMVSSPAASNSNVPNESFVIMELIGKLGNIGNSGEISPHSQPLLASYFNGNNSTNTSCYSTPLNSPPKLNLRVVDNLVKDKLPSLGKSMPMNSSVADFSADPGFAERAARLSCFGTRSLNGRTSQFGLNNNETPYRSNPVMDNGKLSRVSSSPSLKVMGTQGGGIQGNKNSPFQDRSEAANSQEESTVSEQNPNGDSGIKAANDSNSRKRKAASKGKGKETSVSPSPNTNTKVSETNEDSNPKRCKQSEDENGPAKAEEEAKGSNLDEKQNKANTKPPEPPKDYIHVRARRGQATDSHSLAERVRREKISERMRLLQDLVPGCNKVTGKALMLDEIINYVQSLQRQVEFLSMKLASVNTRLDSNMDTLMSKDIFQSNNSMPHSIFPLDSSASSFYGQQSQQNPAMHNNISNGTMSQCPVDPLNTVLCRSLNMQLPSLDQFTDTIPPQCPTFCEGDLQTIVQMGFGQNSNPETPLQSQNLHGSNQVSHMKVEL
ncbi:hypothetical protein SLEP1_g557 [Rubroshorea leprosula]|uniref:BHLH domain-containing protein n=1 Tax=Rubroshorea leprosula TaxID=152421 RepID=A0AAV5HHL6_9ROSI|nr:hypothetical protein SLEP1_g557 [Rubroshorea leprosula]